MDTVLSGEPRLGEPSIYVLHTAKLPVAYTIDCVGAD